MYCFVVPLVTAVLRQYSNLCFVPSQVVFPALDSRVKNVANAYTLEHQVESDLFIQMSDLVATLRAAKEWDANLFGQLICCTEALLTILVQHLAKEEEHVSHYSFDSIFTRHFEL